ncbi:NudC domain-containing protein 2 [Seminavis robusta]|uniref:NudC domain-containing protein 2 n=1 Tax=Seminavis robusta TaxID=568900 RepID=A0A9N8HHJ9_9STRA|nr:NudC domain-containing protein 2 [Seminavis robusta]|eukprot:Sro452_g145920.1 NudC domain-containing protein 2 (227) ;mRNA; f:42344-43024
MSKLTDYSKFDKLECSSDDEEEVTKASVASRPAAPAEPSAQSSSHLPQQPTPSPSSDRIYKNPQTGRHVYEYNGKPVYEWEQNLEEVILYIQAPPVPRNRIHCKIAPRHLQLGITELVEQQGKYFMDEDTFGTVDVSESTWTLEDGMLVIYLAKANKAEVWDVALMGSKKTKEQTATLDPMAKQQVQQEMMLERFQEENPGFDFRGAKFNGNVPDPRTFMEGVKYS